MKQEKITRECKSVKNNNGNNNGKSSIVMISVSPPTPARLLWMLLFPTAIPEQCPHLHKDVFSQTGTWVKHNRAMLIAQRKDQFHKYYSYIYAEIKASLKSPCTMHCVVLEKSDIFLYKN